MRLSIYTIFEELSYQEKSLYTNENRDFDLYAVRIFSLSGDEPSTLRNDTIYITQKNDLIQLQASPEAKFICLGEISKHRAHRFHSVISLSDRISNSEILQYTQEIFDKYNQWHEAITYQILMRDSLQSIFESCAKIAEQPIAFFDTTRSLLFYSGCASPDMSQNIWNHTIKTGYSPAESFDITLANLMETSNIPFIYFSDNTYRNFCRIIAPIKINEIIYGCIGSLKYKNSISPKEYATIYYIQQLFQAALSNSAERNDFSKHLPWFLSKLLHKEEVNRTVLDYNLKKYQKSIETPFVVWAFIKKYSHTNNDEAIQQYLLPLNQNFEQTFAFVYEDQIIIIDYSIYHIQDEKFKRKIIKILKNIDYRSAYSMTFRSITDLHAAFMQTQITLDHTKPEEGYLAAFKDIYSRYLALSTAREDNATTMLYPNIHKLVESKEKYGNMLLETLQTYIISGCNISETAKKLYLHRHTITYRIKLISDLLEVDISSLDDKERFYIYFSCLLVIHTS